jgi:hypothetical protein
LWASSENLTCLPLFWDLLNFPGNWNRFKIPLSLTTDVFYDQHPTNFTPRETWALRNEKKHPSKRRALKQKKIIRHKTIYKKGLISNEITYRMTIDFFNPRNIKAWWFASIVYSSDGSFGEEIFYYNWFDFEILDTAVEQKSGPWFHQRTEPALFTCVENIRS